jgi:hypothetical protein
VRTILEFSAENVKIAACLADDAVWCELLSGSNSLIIRENTGNIRDFDHLGVELNPNKPCLLPGFCRNSLLNRTGNYFSLTGNLIDVSGNFLRWTGNRFYGIVRDRIFAYPIARPTHPGECIRDHRQACTTASASKGIGNRAVADEIKNRVDLFPLGDAAREVGTFELDSVDDRFAPIQISAQMRTAGLLSFAWPLIWLWLAAGARKLVLEDDARGRDADLVVSTLVSQFRDEA